MQIFGDFQCIFWPKIRKYVVILTNLDKNVQLLPQFVLILLHHNKEEGGQKSNLYEVMKNAIHKDIPYQKSTF